MKVDKRGFTMIEILIVIAIIAILALQIMPNFIGFDSEARVATSKGNLSTLRSRITMYRAKTGHYPKALNDLLVEKYYDVGVKRPYLKQIPLELMFQKEGLNDVEVQNSTEPLSGDGGWTYFKDTAEVVIDVTLSLEEDWGSYATQIPSEW